MICTFKIRSRSTGLFKDKGSYESWSKLGTTWNSIRVLKSHLRMIEEQYKNGFPLDWEIIVLYALPGTSIDVRSARHFKEKDIVNMAIEQCNLKKE